LDAARRLLTRADQHINLPPKTFDLLLLLVESRGRVFSKKDLMNALWPDTFVEDGNLTFQISVLRKALGSEGIEWIETLPRFGYRFGNVREVSDPALAGTRVHPIEEAPGQPKRDGSSPKRFLYCWATGVAIAMPIAYLAVAHLRETPPANNSVEFQIAAPEHVTLPGGNSVSLSPAGDRLAFVGVARDGTRQLWLRSLGSLSVDLLEGTEQVDSAFWSPDGQSIAFFASGKLERMDLQSGSIQVICETPIATSTGAWGGDGTILLDTLDYPEIFRVPATGGVAKPLTRLNPMNGETRHSGPQFLPDGRHFIYFVQSDKPAGTGLYLGSIDSAQSSQLTKSTGSGVYARLASGSSYLIFPRGTDLVAQPFDLAQFKLTGASVIVSRRLLITLGGGVSRATITASKNGVLAYRTLVDTGLTELVWVDRSGKRLETVGEPADYSNPALAPDDKRLVVSRIDPQTHTRDLWVFDSTKQSFSRFTFDPADETNAVWYPDGSRVAFGMPRNGVIDLYEKDIAGGSAPKLLVQSAENKYIHEWTPDGKFLLFRIGTLTWARPAAGGTLMGPYAMENPRVSPNGKWVAFTSSQSGRSEVYVQGFPPGDGKWQISSTGAIEPSWRGDGQELYFVSADSLMAVPVRTESSVFEAGRPNPLFEVHLESSTRRTRYQASSTGRRFLLNRPMEPSSPITVAVNWLSIVSR
jgi:Tol biopolymer transport system component/DNA-binding winged helix-turn-helix (wHTH) protein